MTGIPSTYSVGDWVVHHSYGIGQIKDVEKKTIHGEKVPCFRVKTKDSAFWFPKNRSDNPRIRPVAQPDFIRRVKEELQKTVGELDPDRKQWKKRIGEVRSGDDFLETTQIVRDLTLLREHRKLNQTEERALNHFTERLIGEWSVIMGTDVEKIRPKLDRYLKDCKERASLPE